MAKKTHIPLPIQWHEGLLLYPQHFQQQRRASQGALTTALETAQPFFWGVRSCVMDSKALSAGIVKVQELQAIMPDGFPVEITQTDTVELALQGMEKTLSDQTKTIYLCLPEEHDGSANARDDLPRYEEVCSSEHHHVDENTGENAIAVPRLKPRLSLIIGNPPARYVSLPLCAVTFDDGVFVFAPFCPPSCTIGPQDGTLHAMVTKSLDTLHKRITFFVERLQAPLTHESSALLEKYRHTYSVLVRPFFALRALCQQETSHPYTIFLELCRACGDLAAVAPGRMPAHIDPYDHNNPYSCFKNALETLEEYIALVEKPSFTIPFNEENGIFYLHINKQWLKHTPLTLSIHPDKQLDFDSVKSWIEGALIISKSLVSQSQSKRILGAHRTFAEHDEALGLVQTPYRILVHITVAPETIRADEELCIVHLSKAHKAPKAINLCIKEGT